jgi:hypothetical protein
MDLERIEKKLREARFFLDKMRDQESRAFGDKEPFDFYLSAFLNAARTVDYRLRHEQATTYPAWRKIWDANSPTSEQTLINFMATDRRLEVHAKGSTRSVRTEEIIVHGSYSDKSGRVEVSGSLPLGTLPFASIFKPAYNFTIQGVEWKATDACAEYLALIDQMLAKFQADHP